MDLARAAEVIVVDTNLLVYAHRTQVPEHDRARAVLELASRERGGWGIALPSVLEFWSVVTHPASAGRPSRPQEARAYIDALTKAGARSLLPTSGATARLIAAAAEQRIAGARVFDLLIALIARDHGAAEIWTHDHGFVSLPGLMVVDPFSRT